MPFTSSVWPRKVFSGASSPSLQTWMVRSEELVAKVLLFFQSTSSVGAARTANRVSDGCYNPIAGNAADPSSLSSLVYVQNKCRHAALAEVRDKCYVPQASWPSRVLKCKANDLG